MPILNPPGRLQIERLSSGRRQLLRELQYAVDNTVVTVPVGFVTDYSSIPFGFRWIMRWNRVDVAGVVHDYLYRNPIYPRLKADWIWFKVARGGRGPARAWPHQAAAGLIALVLFGWWAKATGPACTTFNKCCWLFVDLVLGLGALWVVRQMVA